MSTNLPLVSIEATKATSRDQAPIPDNFKPVEFDLENSNLSREMKSLIIGGDGIDERYFSDHSRAIYGACSAMIRAGFSDSEIATVLTDKGYYLGAAAYTHVNPPTRENAARWIQKYNIDKLRLTWSPACAFDKPATSLDGSTKSKFVLEKFQDITFDSSSSYLVDNLIDLNSFGIVYGESNSGKTFFMLDLALHIALGWNWHGRKVKRGAVVYVAAEGGRRIKDRVIAFRAFKNLIGKEVPFFLARVSIDLLSPNPDVQSLVDEVIKINSSIDNPVLLIVIDTLSRALSGGNENDSKDMGAFIRNVDRVRSATDTAVVVVHHSGKDVSRGARGHSILRGAVDTEIEIASRSKMSGVIDAKVTKQRDYDFGKKMGFRLQPVEIGKSESGTAVSSCVIEHLTIEDFDEASHMCLKPNSTAAKALSVLMETLTKNPIKEPVGLDIPPGVQITSIELWRSQFIERYYPSVRSRQTKSSAFTNALKKLSVNKNIEAIGDYVWLPVTSSVRNQSEMK